MASSYDPLTTVGQVRLLISDLPDPDTNKTVFTDEEIDAFLTRRDGIPELAAATALRTIAGNAIQVRGRLTMLDARTDAPAESRALLELAESLEAQVDEAGGIAIAGGF
ncbi:hypothetical protein [Phytoactinopolyspora limicola]|uniref:hypothetical protein n=1 Tax=Phytoactinopolyspora limicola TaxID=2715536 RepID=UPI001407B496|nr:hypothetical protein [Phytoactinopolyspora limicola]